MIVVTGATGHIGNVLVRTLIEKGEEVRVIIPEFEDTTSLNGLDVERVTGDVCDKNSLIDAFKDAKIVYHLAGIVSISGRKTKLLHEVNVQGTKNVLQACLETGVERLVYTSSVHAFVEPPHGIVIDETIEINPDKVYGAYAKSKAYATLEVMNSINQGLDFVIVFPSGVIGPYDFKISNFGSLFISYLRGKFMAYVAGAYDFVDVRDLANGMISACKRGRSGEGYIISGNRITVDEIIHYFRTITGIKSSPYKMPFWLAKLGAFFSPLYYSITQAKPKFTRYSLHVLASNSFISCKKAR
ncbi:MAG: NAD-dependent epimerase/dehydratase family protein, partial [Desulfobacterales bacterium]|nr:NAD-dependent epimerase/dehydratase family protein [Desulfobacterales bacterium]